MFIPELKEWIIERLKFKDVLLRKIKDIRVFDNSNSVEIDYSDKKVLIEILPILDLKSYESIKTDRNLILVCLNSKDNIDFLVANWSNFIKNNSLNIYFINPKLEIDNFWMVNPKIHETVIESSKYLEKSLKVIYSSVKKLTPKQLESKPKTSKSVIEKKSNTKNAKKDTKPKNKTKISKVTKKKASSKKSTTVKTKSKKSKTSSKTKK